MLMSSPVPLPRTCFLQLSRIPWGFTQDALLECFNRIGREVKYYLMLWDISVQKKYESNHSLVEWKGLLNKERHRGFVVTFSPSLWPISVSNMYALGVMLYPHSFSLFVATQHLFKWNRSVSLFCFFTNLKHDLKSLKLQFWWFY